MKPQNNKSCRNLPERYLQAAFKKTCVFFFVMVLAFQLMGCKSESKRISEKLSEADKNYLLKVIDSIYNLDQSKRKDISKIDSIFGVKNLNPYSIVEQSKRNRYRKSKDSMWQIIKTIDESNTKLLISLTKKYGFPNNKRLGEFKSKAYFIFVHSPYKYEDEIKALINNEFSKGRISKYKKDYIYWHLNRRKGLPPRSGQNGKAIKQ